MPDLDIIMPHPSIMRPYCVIKLPYTVQTVGRGGGDTRFVAANTVCYETDTPDLARRER